MDWRKHTHEDSARCNAIFNSFTKGVSNNAVSSETSATLQLVVPPSEANKRDRSMSSYAAYGNGGRGGGGGGGGSGGGGEREALSELAVASAETEATAASSPFSPAPHSVSAATAAQATLSQPTAMLTPPPSAPLFPEQQQHQQWQRVLRADIDPVALERAQQEMDDARTALAEFRLTNAPSREFVQVLQASKVPPPPFEMPSPDDIDIYTYDEVHTKYT